MKLSRDALKSIVKECLIEILQEGIGSLHVKEGSRRGAAEHHFPERGNSPKKLLTANKTAPSAALMQAIKQESGGDSIMQSILADTAVTTLPAMLANSTPGGEALVPLSGQGVGVAEMVVAQASPEDLFGEDAASKWTTLAFMPNSGPKAA